MENGLSELLRSVLKWYRTVIVVVFGPIYFAVLMIMMSKKHIRSNTAYNIMLQIGSVDIVCLLTIGLAVVMSWYEKNFPFPLLMQVASFSRCLYFISMFSFTLLLAVNRLLSIVGFKIAIWIHKLTLIVTWTIIAGVFPLMFKFVGEIESEYDYQYALYFHFGPFEDEVVTNVELGLYIGAILTYALLFGAIIFKRLKHSQKLKVKSPEGRLLIRSVVLFLPQGVTFFAIKRLQDTSSTIGEIFLETPSIVFSVNILTDFLPVLHLLVFLVFNRTINGVIRRVKQKFKTKRIFTVKTLVVSSSSNLRSGKSLS
ncbi:hypothetical protein L596_026482 [Steinernema carpocapsae]|uniref:G-protein coupled receptors family 1 profile domain-containing protein n=1 Tax=Steinernema carpocapsae TaxID=34508 RepID=A0A4U5M1I7_STECR|nr:hypothetical protein L596_026482 [Steinernema carpocapsae]